MTDDTLPAHLEAIGRQLTAAARDLAPPPRRSRRRALGLAAVSTTGLAAIATAAVLAVGATTGTPPAFAVTRLHDGSVSVKINRTSSIADVNRKLAAMGIHKIDKRAMAAGDASSSIPSCSSIPPGWKGEWVQISAVPIGNTGTTVSSTFAPGTWHLVYCAAVNPGYPGSGDTGNAGNTASGNTVNTGAGATTDGRRRPLGGGDSTAGAAVPTVRAAGGRAPARTRSPSRRRAAPGRRARRRGSAADHRPAVT
jgi:hypothetical protein